MDLLIRNISQLVLATDKPPVFAASSAMVDMPVLENSYLLISGDKIQAFGTMNDCPERAGQVIDAGGRIVMPAFCDSHTHLVYAASREKEFVDRIKGLSYEEIALRGGGILNSAKLLRNTTENELYDLAMVRIAEIIYQGTGAVEIKSGYGLDTASELKMLRVIRRIKETTTIEVKATFLGAHAVPAEYQGDQNGYVDLIIRKMLPVIAAEKLAEFVDVFCDRGFFTPDNTARILEASEKLGLIPKIHANELEYSGGIQIGVRYHALSVDHLECTGEEEIRILKDTATMPTLLPGAALFLGLPWPPARKMIDSGLPVALGSDFNPGSCPTGNMMLMIALACINMKMLPEESLFASTLNSAYAMNLSGELGTLTPGKNANVIITRPVPDYSYLPYAFGSDLVEKVIIKGKILVNKESRYDQTTD
ncbi:MAG: imidazolonepropionase [Bacteroidetes bacterium GWF2_49_14]|nr:MAG: imidazolonepropionase [Bacteroidetes bacterium GWF2_49_14]HBB93646.1 imidazolonepropionase [Bacteroidales bacterium]